MHLFTVLSAVFKLCIYHLKNICILLCKLHGSFLFYFIKRCINLAKQKAQQINFDSSCHLTSGKKVPFI